MESVHGAHAGTCGWAPERWLVGAHLDGDGVEVDLLKGTDLAGLDEAAELGAGHPLLLAVVPAPTAPATAAATEPTAEPTAPTLATGATRSVTHADCRNTRGSWAVR